MDRTDAAKNGEVQPPPDTNVAIGVTMNVLAIRRDPEVIRQTDDERDEKISRNFTIKLHEKLKFSIYKPLIPLKAALFIWYGAAAAIGTFLLVFFKQRGLTLTELSIVYAISPVAQFIGTTMSGVIADKLGRSKPVLVVNILLNVAVVVAMLLVPGINLANCEPQLVKLKCHHNEFGRLIAKTSCDVNTDVIELAGCNVTCPENVTQYCNGQNLICEMLEGNEDFGNLSLSVHVNWAYKLKNKCYYNVTSMSHENASYSWCNVPHKMYCRIACLMNPEDDCGADDANRPMYLMLNMALLICFFTFFSNIYRFMDVTAMCLVKQHNSDFGRERFFAIAGMLIFSPMAGYVVDLSTPEGANQNYEASFYLFIVMVIMLLGVIYVLPVEIRQPGTNMWKKALLLLRNFDNVNFIIVLFVLGSAWGFTKNFTSWYLEGMKIPGFLLGLIGSISALYGLPFLVTSNWWVKRIGTREIFILGLLGYVASGIGYSFLYDPWLSLLIEATTIVTYHLLWVAVIVHSHSIAPEGLTATVISTAGGIHYSLGKGSGGFVGGLIMESFGGRAAYRVVAASCLITAVYYALYLFISKTFFSKSHDLSVKAGNINSTYDSEGATKEQFVMENKI